MMTLSQKIPSEKDAQLIPYEELIAYAAGELDEVRSAIVANHVTACAECTETVNRIRASVRLGAHGSPRHSARGTSGFHAECLR